MNSSELHVLIVCKKNVQNVLRWFELQIPHLERSGPAALTSITVLNTLIIISWTLQRPSPTSTLLCIFGYLYLYAVIKKKKRKWVCERVMNWAWPYTELIYVHFGSTDKSNPTPCWVTMATDDVGHASSVSVLVDELYFPVLQQESTLGWVFTFYPEPRASYEQNWTTESNRNQKHKQQKWIFLY